MKMFKILHTESELFSNGGTCPGFCKKGKLWKTQSGISNHLSWVEESDNLKFYEGCVVVIYDVIESDEPRIDVISEYVPAKNARRKCRKI